MNKIINAFRYKPLNQTYAHASRWQTLKWRMKEFTKKVVRIFAVTGLTAGTLYGTFMAGAYFNPTVSYAIKDREVIVKDTSFPPILQRICKAESGLKQFKEDGKVLRGHTTPSDIGYCQISEVHWNDKARELGIDIYTEQGNKDMALYIFENQGTDPWNASKCSKTKVTNCW